MSAIDSFGSYFPTKNFNESTKLHKLRYHLAVEGCSHSQLSLAKSFLQDAAQTDAERKENAELALRWLLLATSEGNTEAFQLLENCYKMGIGVTAGNREHIEQCLRSSREEKLAQRVGCNLFRLIAYDTREAIPLDYFQQRVTLYINEEDIIENHNLNTENTKYSSMVYITTKDVVKSVHSCLLGECPAISLNNIQQNCHLNSQNYDSYSQLFVSYLNGSFKTYLTSLDAFCLTLAEIPVCLNFIVFLFLFFFASAVFLIQSEQSIVLFAQYAISYYLFVIIIVTSARMVRSEENKNNIEKWKQVIHRFDSTAADDIPKHSTLHTVLNFAIFFISLLIFVTFIDFHRDNFILFGKWILLSFSLTKADMGRSSALSNMFLVLSFFVAFSRITVGLDAFNWLSTSLFSISLPVNDQKLTFRPVTLISFFSWLLYSVLFCTRSLFSSLPFLAMYFWFNVIFNDVHHVFSTFYCLMLISLVFSLLKKFNLYGTVFLGFLAIQCLTPSQSLISIMCMMVLLLSFKLTSIIMSINNKYYLPPFKVYGVLLFFTPFICAYLLPNLSFNTAVNFGTHENVTWSIYSKSCHRHAWSETNMVHTQMNCDKYIGWTITFEGNVEKVFRKQFLSLDLPRVLGFQLAEPFVSNGYEIILHIKGTFSVEAEIFIQTDDMCRDFVLDIQNGDLLSVIGTLKDGIGTSKPVVILKSSECISCMDNVRCDVKKTDWFQYTIPKLVLLREFLFYPWII